MTKLTLTAAAFAAAMMTTTALAQTAEITIGITIATTGPAAALGIPERNALEFVPKEIGGVPLKVIVLDDGGDPTAATTNARRFVTESKADIIMGSSTTPPSVAISTVANEAGIPHFALAPMPVNAGAREMDRRDAAAGADHGQGDLRAHEGEGRQDRSATSAFRIPTAICGSTISRPRPDRWA